MSARTLRSGALCALLAFELTSVAFGQTTQSEKSAGSEQMEDMPGMQPAKTPTAQPPMPGRNMPGEKGASQPETSETKLMGSMSGMSSMGVLGSYPLARDASGTSWQPDASEPMGGFHVMSDDWMLMGHLSLFGVYDSQSGPRGGDKLFPAGMLMGMARRDFADGDTLNLRAMLSVDPLMGKSGYPLLLGTGETANGVTPLIDRQHPHDFFTELAGSYAHRFNTLDGVFLYAGYPGEPALGPTAFPHRASAMDFPIAPITHHWLDSTHLVFGVLTAGFVHDDWKFEVSQFTGASRTRTASISILFVSTPPRRERHGIPMRIGLFKRHGGIWSVRNSSNLRSTRTATRRAPLTSRRSAEILPLLRQSAGD